MQKEGDLQENGIRVTNTSSGRFAGRSVIYGKDDEHDTPYMTRYWIGRLRLHIFYRGDQDPDCHDHPWDFWTLPFSPYVEEVIVTGQGDWERFKQIIPALRWSFRPAEHTHRVLGRWDGAMRVGAMTYHATAFSKPLLGEEPVGSPGRLVTLVWRSREKRSWGFWKYRLGEFCWVGWREYVFGNGKNSPCQ